MVIEHTPVAAPAASAAPVATPAPVAPAAPVIEFVDEPGEGPFAELFGEDLKPAKVGDGEENFGFDEENDEGEGEEENTPAQPAALSSVDEARFAVMEATNQSLQATLTQMTQTQQKAAIDTLMEDFESAVALGDEERTAEVKKQLAEVRSTPAAGVAPVPGQQPVVAPGGAVPPAGHWSNNIRTEAQTWLKAQSWYGVDIAKTKAVQEVGTILDFTKFGTKDEYFAAIQKHVDGGAKPMSEPTPGALTGKQPQPRAKGESERAPASRKSGPAKITSVSQLRGEQREAADVAMRVGGISEAQYLASLNDVRRSVAKNRKKG